MKIMLTEDWAGNPKGTILSLPPIMAMSVVEYYKVAVVILKDDVEKKIESKEIENAPIDKMVRKEDELKKEDGRRNNGRRKTI